MPREDPVRTLRDAGWRDAFAVAGHRTPYSYVYDGQLGRLDHALLSPALAAAPARRGRVAQSTPTNRTTSGYRAGGNRAVAQFRPRSAAAGFRPLTAGPGNGA